MFQLPGLRFSLEVVFQGGALKTDPCLFGFDDAAAQADIALVEDDILARRYSALRLVEAHFARAIGKTIHFRCLIRLAITYLRRAAKIGAWWRASDPSELRSAQLTAQERRMIVTLYDDGHVTP